MVKVKLRSGFIRFKNICSVTEMYEYVIVLCTGFMADGVGTASGSSTQSRRLAHPAAVIGLALALKPVRGLRPFTTVGLPCGPSN